jgi:transcriptional regulator with XRE-family HTH domain
MPQRNLSARKTFASNVRRVRLRLGLTQEELADRSGLHRTYVGSVERGERNISIDNMERLASALDAEVEELLRPVRAKA